MARSHHDSPLLCVAEKWNVRPAVRRNLGHCPLAEGAPFDVLFANESNTIMSFVIADVAVQLFHHRLFALQSLDKPVIGDDQGPADSQLLVVGPRYAENGSELRLTVVWDDSAMAVYK